MSEIEKMYENAGVEYGSCQNYSRFEQCCNSPFCDSGMCLNGIGGEKHPFTAEKQLSLIKWLGIRDEFNFYQNKVTKDWVFYDHEKDATHYNFELGLASWIDYLWQDLTEQERTQIAEILKG